MVDSDDVGVELRDAKVVLFGSANVLDCDSGVFCRRGDATDVRCPLHGKVLWNSIVMGDGVGSGGRDTRRERPAV